jgi:Mlc titration factor MtfA (ptsG expression regulator)
MLNWLRRLRAPAEIVIDEPHWARLRRRLPLLDGMDAGDLARLRQASGRFLATKSVYGARGLELDSDMQLLIAAQACLPVLNLGLEAYEGWQDVIVYPDEFVPVLEWTDEAGVQHRRAEPRIGEAWARGPLVLSWADVKAGGRGDGFNVVIHECAHKLDMLDGDANGCPPLHAGMSRSDWHAAWSAGFDMFRARTQRMAWLDPYAAESPEEFFAVMSEAFFELPWEVRGALPEVYQQLVAFYRWEPMARGGGQKNAGPGLGARPGGMFAP